MRIREFRKEDLPGIEAIERESFSDPWTADSLRSTFCCTGAAGLVLCGDRDRDRSGDRDRDEDRDRDGERESEIYGFALSLLLFEDAQLVNIAVAPAFRGRGYGAALLEETLRRLAAGGARRVTLEVRASGRAAIALYRRFGFSPIAVRKNYYQLPTEDAIIMEYHYEHPCD